MARVRDAEVADLLKIIKSKNEDIKMLKEQVDLLIYQQNLKDDIYAMEGGSPIWRDPFRDNSAHRTKMTVVK